MAENTRSPAAAALIVSGLLALLGTIAGGVVKGYWDVQLAERKYSSDLVLKALESKSPQERLETLRMLVHTNLLKESSLREGVDSYITEKKQDPESIPQVRSAVAPVLEAPIIENARVYLLSGTKEQVESLAALRGELSASGFSVMGAKSLNDPGRPDYPEVRYFHPSDKEQAERIAEFMRFKLSASTLAATQYQDPKVNPGYIEVWLGR